MRRDLNLAVLSHLPGPYAVSGGFRQADAQIDGEVEIASAVDGPAEVRSSLDMLASKVSGVTSTANRLTASADDFSASLSR